MVFAQMVVNGIRKAGDDTYQGRIAGYNNTKALESAPEIVLTRCKNDLRK